MSSLRPALASDRDLAKIRAAKETVHPALAVLRAGHFLTKHQWYLSSAPNITDNARSGPLALAFRPLSPPALPQWTPSSELVLTRDGEGQWGWHVAPGMRFWSIEPSAPAFVAFGDPEIGARLITLILEDADTVMDEGDEARASALREVARRLGIACAELKARGGAAAKSTAGKATARKTTRARPRRARPRRARPRRARPRGAEPPRSRPSRPCARAGRYRRGRLRFVQASEVATGWFEQPFSEAVQAFETEYFNRLMADGRLGWNLSDAARRSGFSRKGLRGRLKRHGVYEGPAGEDEP